jgi:hypothetical protein
VGQRGTTVSTVLVHNNDYRSERLARQAWGTPAEVSSEYWWNLWMRRQEPFNLIIDGMPVLLLDSWRVGGLVSWLVHAHDVHTGSFPDKDAAIRAIARWAGKSRRWVLGDPYTSNRPDEARHVIFWRAAPVRRIDVPRPSQLTVRRNGWFITNEAELSSWGIHLNRAGHAPGGTATTTPRAGRGQGRQVDVDTKLAIERCAMTVARTWCRSRGWVDVRDVSGNHSWDLEATDDAGRTRFIEVKGTVGGPDSVEVTKGEVDWARIHGDDHLMVIVHGIDVTARGGTPVTRGGQVVAYEPWEPDPNELAPQTFIWRPAASRRRAAAVPDSSVSS